MKVEDVSKGDHTALRTQLQIGGTDRTLEVRVLGRDAWAYQFAKIELQNRALTERRCARSPPARSGTPSAEWPWIVPKLSKR